MRTAFLPSALVALQAVSCGSGSTEPAAGGNPEAAAVVVAPGPGAFQADFATSSEFFTRMAKVEKGRSDSPHNLVRIFYSANLKPVITEASFSTSVGTVAIKQQDRNGDGVIENVLAMIKQPAGYDPDNGDWLYEQRAADGTLQNSGKTAFCIGCHQGFSATDFLAGTMLHDP